MIFIGTCSAYPHLTAFAKSPTTARILLFLNETVLFTLFAMPPKFAGLFPKRNSGYKYIPVPAALIFPNADANAGAIAIPVTSQSLS